MDDLWIFLSKTSPPHPHSRRIYFDQLEQGPPKKLAPMAQFGVNVPLTKRTIMLILTLTLNRLYL
jgi:hypothetical protein